MASRAYRSRIDPSVALCLMLPMGLSVGMLGWELLQGTPLGQVIAVVSLLPGLVLPLWMLLGTHYLLTAERLLIRCGPFRWRIRLAEIRAVTPTRSLLSGPALSLDRLRIDHGHWNSVLISPHAREDFLARLAHLRVAVAAH
ncbi:MAG: PH domain-containing protein [Pseudoxanthomonas sp.]